MIQSFFVIEQKKVEIFYRVSSSFFALCLQVNMMNNQQKPL